MIILFAACFFAEAGALSGGKTCLYYPDWASTSRLDRYDFSKLDYVFYSFYSPDRYGNIDTGYMQLDSALLDSLSVKAHAANAKVILSFGGGGGSSYDPDTALTSLTSNPANQTHFVHNLMSLLRYFNLDGIDNDWEPFIAPSSKAAAFEGLMREIRDSMNAQEPISGKTYLLSEALITSATWADVNFMDYVTSGTISITDFFSPMTYNEGPHALDTTAAEIDAWVGHGIPANKLFIGLPFYSDCDQWPAPAAFSARSYSEIWTDSFDLMKPSPDSIDLIGINSDTVKCSEWCYSPYLVREAAELAFEKGCAGTMVWDLDNDVPTDSSHSLLRSISSLSRYLALPDGQRNLLMEQSSDSTADASSGLATWSVFGTGSSSSNGYVADSRGGKIPSGSYNFHDKSASGTLHLVACDSAHPLSRAGFDLTMKRGANLPLMNLSPNDTVFVDLSFDSKQVLDISLRYPGNQDAAHFHYAGKGVRDTAKILVSDFIADVVRLRRWTPGNTGVISFEWNDSMLDNLANDLPDSANLRIYAVGINSIAAPATGILRNSSVDKKLFSARISGRRLILNSSALQGTVSLFTSSGRRIATQIIHGHDVMDMSALTDGIYFVRLESSSGTISSKIILSK